MCVWLFSWQCHLVQELHNFIPRHGYYTFLLCLLTREVHFMCVIVGSFMAIENQARGSILEDWPSPCPSSTYPHGHSKIHLLVEVLATNSINPLGFLPGTLANSTTMVISTSLNLQGQFQREWGRNPWGSGDGQKGAHKDAQKLK